VGFLILDVDLSVLAQYTFPSDTSMSDFSFPVILASTFRYIIIPARRFPLLWKKFLCNYFVTIKRDDSFNVGEAVNAYRERHINIAILRPA
jgi:hypothetical protein